MRLHDTNWLLLRDLFREGGGGISLSEFDELTNKRIRRIIDEQQKNLERQRQEFEKMQEEQERKSARKKIIAR